MAFWVYNVGVKRKHIFVGHKFINEANDVDSYHNYMFWLRIHYRASFKDIERFIIITLLYCFEKRVLGSQTLYDNKLNAKVLRCEHFCESL